MLNCCVRCGEEGQRWEAPGSTNSHMAGQPPPAVSVHDGEEANASQFGHCPSPTACDCLVDPEPSLPAVSDSVGTPGGTADNTRWADAVGVGPGGVRGVIPPLGLA